MNDDVFLTTDIQPFEIIRPSDGHTLLVLAAVWELHHPWTRRGEPPAMRYPTLAAADDMHRHLAEAGKPMRLAVRPLDVLDLTAVELAFLASAG